ncbi:MULTISPECIES: ATP-binding protein [unclassified Streptomyces]|uniref:ATP-binding protein n=1 Tax=unclassified Streptomyces TaxID=2593676 RepID=UPI003803607E
MTSLMTPVDLSSVGHPTYRQSFPNEPSTAGLGRHLLREVLGIWRLKSLTDVAALVVTELIANAARHTPCREIRLSIERPSATWLRLGVLDRAPTRLPMLDSAGRDAESGRGLFLVDALADRWGYDLRGPADRAWGKEVWAELRIADST